MLAKPRRSEQGQIPLFRVPLSIPRWENLPSHTRTEIVRLVANLLVQIRRGRGNAAERSNDE